MQLGIKIGLLGNSIEDLETVHPAFAEVWFYINRLDEYDHLFAHLKQEKIPAGLHFWGHTQEGFCPTICSADISIYKESVALMKQTIDVAARHNFVYVNIHPGVRVKLIIDRIAQKTSIHSDPAPLELAEKQFLETASELSQYAKQKNVLLTVETVNINNYDEWMNNAVMARQNNIYTIYEMPLSTLVKASQQGIYICNDFAHTTGTIMTDSADSAWEHTRTMTEVLAAATKLIHMGFIIAPFNGTDFHDELDNKLFETSAAVPNKPQMIELLKLFQNRPDVRILVEPSKDHPKNYILAQKLLKQAGVLDPQN